VQIARRVVAHARQIELLENVERLQHHGPLHPGVEFVNVDPAVVRVTRLFDLHLPTCEIFFGDESAFGLDRRGEFCGDVATIKTLVSRHDGLLSGCAAGERTPFGFDQFSQCRSEFRLPKNFASLRALTSISISGATKMRQHHSGGVRPFFNL